MNLPRCHGLLALLPLLALLTPSGGCLFLAEPPTSIKLLEDEPEPELVSPVEGEVVSGTWPVEVALGSTLAVTGTLYLDGEEVEDFEDEADESTRHAWAWDTTTAEQGMHTLRLLAEDEVGREAEVELEVLVDQLPEVHVEAPTEGEVLEGDVLVSFEVSDDGEVERMALLRDGVELDAREGVPASMGFSTCATESGTWTLTVAATDDVGNVGTGTVEVESTRPLEVSLDLEDTVLSPDQRVEAELVWDGGVASFEVLLDGAELWRVDEAPAALGCSSECEGRCGTFSERWDTTALAEGEYTLEAVLTDSTGRVASDRLTVTVDHDQDGDGHDADAYGGSDCDDGDPEVNPGEAEACDGKDNDCDTEVDEGFDADGDGAPGHADCPEDEAWADCDDGDATVFPGAEEVCGDGIDNDCDGPDAACRTTGTASAAAIAWATWTGESQDDWLGWSLELAGDLDGDGTEDLLMGSVYVDPDDAGYRPGGWYLLDGAAVLASAGGGEVQEVAQARILSTGDEDQFGWSSAALGDLDGDGYDDLALGEPLYDTQEGAAWLFYGPLTGELTTLHRDGGFGDDGYFVGRSLAAGDLDGDGDVDLVSGACINNYSWETVLWYEGPLSSSNPFADVSADADDASGAGCAVEVVGDTDGDGIVDLLVGGPLESSVSEDAGGAWLLTDIPASSDEDISAHADAFLRGQGEGNEVGWEVAAAGDVDGDGYADVLLGAEKFDEDAGRAWLFEGPLAGTVAVSGADATFVGGSGSAAGMALAGADLDGDGRSDVVVGVPYASPTAGAYAGAVAVFYGPPSGTADVPDDGDWILEGSETSGYLGQQLHGLGDLDGDGAEDLLLGAPGTGSDRQGSVYLLLGELAH